MKIKTNNVLIAVALLAYWVGLCNASAFYDPGQQRWLNRDLIGEPGFEAMRFAVKSKSKSLRLSIGAELTADQNLYRFVGNKPVNYTDPLGLDSYGNPISGPNGPVGPSSPYAPGGPYYPNGYLYTIPPDPVGDCINRCMSASGAGWALGALGLSTGTVGSIPKPIGVGNLGGGSWTTVFSNIQFIGGPPLRNIGRQLNPYGRAVQCFSLGYLLGLYSSCSANCSSDRNSF